MTALGWRRHQNLRTAGAVGAVAALFMGLAIAVGVSALANSDAGRDVTGGAVPDRVRLPFTATAAVGVTDARGVLVSVAVMVLRPEGVGGSVVVVPADSILDIELSAATPLIDGAVDDQQQVPQAVTPADAWRNGGPDGLAARLEALTSVSLDLVEVVSGAEIEREMADVLGVEATLRWTPPEGLGAASLVALVDSGIVGSPVLPGVERNLAPRAALALAAWNPPDVDDRGPLRRSLWRALIEAAPASGERSADSSHDVQEFLRALRSGPIGMWALGSTDVIADPQELGQPGQNQPGQNQPGQNQPGQNQPGQNWGDHREVLDRAEILLVFGQIAPARLGAPNPSSRFRVVATFDSAQLTGVQSAAVGRTNAAIARGVIADLVVGDANVVSVLASDPAPDGARAPAVTRVEVADAAMREALTQQWSGVFGEFEVVVAGIPVDGVDATVVLGVSFLRDEE